MKLNLKQRIKNIRTPKEREGLVLSLEKDGNRYYTFPDPVAMGNIRNEQVLARIHQVELGIIKPHLRAFTKTIREEGVGGNMGNILMLNNYFDNYIEQPINVAPMLYLSMPLILLNDEPIKEAPESYEIKKLELQKNDDEIRGFFLASSIGIVASYQTGLESTEIWSQIMNPIHRRIENQFLKLIGIHNF